MSSQYGRDAAQHTADFLRKRVGEAAPEVGIALGSGLGRLAEDISDPVRVPFAEIPGFPAATVVGHAGAMVSGTLNGKRVIAACLLVCLSFSCSKRTNGRSTPEQMTQRED